MLLKRNGDNSKNFNVNELYGEKSGSVISRHSLKYEITQLFSSSCEVALFYFAGHGFSDENGGYILTQNVRMVMMGCLFHLFQRPYNVRML